ncbi:MAG: bifunctional folylpolyglutamate synthase/dihydrofolate synthase [Lachnospiraceae bacterium]
MTQLEAKQFLDKMGKKGSIYGLDTIRELLYRLGNPQQKLKIVHIAGTNGKGSILTMIETVMIECGYHTGKYTSPCIGAYGEQFLYDQNPIPIDKLLAYMEKIKVVSERMREEERPLPTVFEIETALAFLYFVDQEVDIVLLETGMGGLLDATNVVEHPILTIFASISMDHMNFLGNSIEEIAKQKAGIIKEYCPVICYMSDEKAVEVIRQEAKKKKSPFYLTDKTKIKILEENYEMQRFSYGDSEEYSIPLLGEHQVYNAATAVLALEYLGKIYHLPKEKIKKGLSHTKWSARLELVKKDPLIFLDGAHNEDAAKYLSNFIQKHFTNKRIIYIIGVLADKEYKKMIRRTANLAAYIFTITPNNPRALDAKILEQEVKKENPHVKAMSSLKSAYSEAMKMARKEDIIFVFGSLSFMSEIKMVLDEEE